MNTSIIQDVVDCVNIQCDNSLDDMAILNMFFAKFASVIASKNVMTDSCLHVQKMPLSYYGLNFLNSGTGKTLPAKIIKNMFNWLDDIYSIQKEKNKEAYIEKNLNLCHSLKEEIKMRPKIEEDASRLFDVLETNIGSITASGLYSVANTIKQANFGSIFFYDTEFLQKFEEYANKNNFDSVLKLIFNLYDGDLDFLKTSSTIRTSINNLSCSCCFASSFTKLLRDTLLFNRFKEFLNSGFARRTFIYIEPFKQFEAISPTVEERLIAKNNVKQLSAVFKNIYDNISTNAVFEFSIKANKLILSYKNNLKNYLKENIIYNQNGALPLEDEIIEADLIGSTWKIVKLAYLFHFLENPKSFVVSENSVQQAIDYYNNSRVYLLKFLQRLPLDFEDKIRFFINKNLDVNIDLNNVFKKLYPKKIRENWKKYKNNELEEFLSELLADDDIYYNINKDGKKTNIKFVKKGKTDNTDLEF